MQSHIMHQQTEGKFKPGKIITNPKKVKILSVTKDKHGVISEYLIENLG